VTREPLPQRPQVDTQERSIFPPFNINVPMPSNTPAPPANVPSGGEGKPPPPRKPA
jgi:hypothetical protein